MVEDKIGITGRNKWGFVVSWVYALLIIFVSGLLFFSGGGKLDDFVGVVYYYGVIALCLTGLSFLQRAGWSVYLFEPKMGIQSISTLRIFYNPLLKFWIGLLFFLAIALLLSFKEFFAGIIPKFQVLAVVSILLDVEPTVFAETLLLIVIPLTITRRLFISIAGGQNFFFYAIMLLIVCSGLFFVGYGYHGLRYNADEGNRIVTGVLFWLGGVLTVVFGDIILAWLFHGTMNLFNSAQDVFTGDFYKFFVLVVWFLFVVFTIAGIVLYWSIVSSRDGKKSESFEYSISPNNGGVL